MPAILRTGRGKNTKNICFLVAPAGQAGGGMGRVMDHLMEGSGGRLGELTLVSLDSRGQGGFVRSLSVMSKAIFRIWWNAALGKVALVHVNVGDHGSMLRKGLIIFASRLAAVPVLLHLHAVQHERFYESSGFLRRFFIRSIFHASSLSVGLGRRWEVWLQEVIRLPPQKVATLSNGVYLPSAYTETRVERAEVQILFLGNLLERKGVSDLIVALSHVHANFSWRLTMAGGGDIAHYRGIAEENGIGNKVDFVGWLEPPAVRQLLSATDLMVLPSYDEGLPLSILEALGFGVPIVCTDVGAIPEYLEHGKTALIVHPGDRDALSAALESIILDRDFRQKLATQGRELYQTRFNINHFMSELLKLYRILQSR